ncbi:MAG: DNA-directed RNA polymerase subunit alpha [Candidatus Liptonbacteria bacterium]|nr:DNA-directed RNA polymerase subunit alpha [Candidatus Liptonbacteria bacterium]
MARAQVAGVEGGQILPRQAREIKVFLVKKVQRVSQQSAVSSQQSAVNSRKSIIYNMEFAYLSSTVVIKTVSEDGRQGVFEIEGLYAGYGLTIGNALRRTLLSSLPGAAVTQLKIKGVPHEFTTLPGVKEDMVELSLGFKKLRFRMHTDEPQVLRLEISGVRTVTGRDIELNPEVELVNPDLEIAHLTTKNAELSIELKVERGLGYWPVEARKGTEKLPIGSVAIDAIFSPVTRVNFTVENMRVGDRTDFNRIRLEVETDTSLTPSSALHKAASILKDHFEKVIQVEVKEPEVSAAPAVTKSRKKKAIE